MNNSCIKSELSELQELIGKMKAALEWQKLRYFENSQSSLSQLFFEDRTQQEMINLKAQFEHGFNRLASKINRNSAEISENCKKESLKKLTKLALVNKYISSGIRFF